MKEITNHLSGLDLSPLLHESCLSPVWRLQWRNAADATAIRQLISKKNRFQSNETFDHYSWFDYERIIKSIGWSILGKREFDMAQSFLICSTVRFCPLCLEAAYHSYWFQLLLVEYCPIHRVKLSSRCYSCNATMPTFGADKETFAKHFYCFNCEKPFSGAPLSLDHHLHLRNNSSVLENAFKELANWWDDGEKMRTSAVVISTKAKLFWYGGWCDKNAFLSSLAYLGSDIPTYCSRPKYIDITVVSWRLRLHASSLLCVDERHTKRSTLPRLQGVYKSSIRYIERWISKTFGLTRSEYVVHCAFKITNNILYLKHYGYRPELLALCILRSRFENYFCAWRDAYDKKVINGILDNKDKNYALSMDIFEYIDPAFPRLTNRAILLGLYISWYWRIKNANQKGFMNFKEECLRDGYDTFIKVSKVSDANDENYCEGSLAFRSTPGLTNLVVKNSVNIL